MFFRVSSPFLSDPSSLRCRMVDNSLSVTPPPPKLLHKSSHLRLLVWTVFSQSFLYVMTTSSPILPLFSLLLSPSESIFLIEKGSYDVFRVLIVALSTARFTWR